MKRKNLLISVLLVCVMSVFALSGCGEKETKVTGQRDSIDMLLDAFKATKEQENYVVKTKYDGDETYTLSVDGDKISVLPGYYVYAKDGQYVCQAGSGDSKLILTYSREAYESSRFKYLTQIKGIRDLSVDYSKFSCVKRSKETVSEEDGKEVVKGTAKVIFDCDCTEKTVNVAVDLKDGLVTKIVYNEIDNRYDERSHSAGNYHKFEATFEYGSASVTIPD